MSRGLLVTLVAATLWSPRSEASFQTNIAVPRADAPAASVSVYLPPDYQANPSARYPLLVLLHGLGGADEDWQKLGHIDVLLDRAIARGVIGPVIAVMPDGSNGYWTDWPDGRPDHRFGALVDPIVTSWAEANYRTDGHRVIAGVSMGGFGALSIALRSPERWTAALSFSGALFTKPPTSKPVYLAAFGTPGLRQYAFPWNNPITLARIGQADHLPLWLDCGKDDLPKFTGGLKAMSKVLSARGVPHTHQLRPGRHEWGVWNQALEAALPWIEAQLVKDGARR